MAWDRIIAVVLVVLAAAGDVARAEDEKTAGGIDTEHLFGFSTGTDIGEAGDRELEGQLNGRFFKRTGTYAAVLPMVGYEWVPVANLRLEATASFAYHDIAGVMGLDDRRQAAPQGISFEARYRFMDRERAPFGLAIDVEPHWGRVDETSGAPVDQYGVDVAILADKTLIENCLVGVANLIYQPEATRSRVTGEWMRETTLGASAGLMVQVHQGLFIGAEARYLRRYDSLDLRNFSGHALFLGPMAFANLDAHWWVSAALSVQVAGRAVDDPGPLDLANFERLQARLRIGYNF
jgi:hypothetical protein